MYLKEDNHSPRRISFVGNIGSGKTELARQVHSRLPDSLVFLEDISRNPFLSDFINDPYLFSFHNQIQFLTTALKTCETREHSKTDTVQDYSMMACPLFAKALMAYNVMSKRDYEVFDELCRLVIRNCVSPTICIYVTADLGTLIERIRLRGRESERAISPDYLKCVQEVHESDLPKWLQLRNTPHLSIATDSFDVTQKDHVDKVFALLQPYLKVPDARRIDSCPT